jgi:uncharacterized protein
VSELKLHFANDFAVAYLDVPKTNNVKPSLHILQTLIKRNHIVYGVNDAILKEIGQGKLTGNNIPIAVGQPMKPGVRGYIEWLVARSKSQETECGIGDQVKLQTYVNVSKGKKLARIIKAVPGTPGTTVTGESIDPPVVDDVSVIIGKGAFTDGDTIVALVDGAVLFDGKTIKVSNSKTIKGDVDHSTGNVLFNGFLKIEGTVRSGAKVTSTGDIIIDGDVEDAEVKCGGSVIIQGGAAGDTRGTINCTGSLLLKYASNFSITAGKDVTIRENALHTAIVADENVWVKNIVGGMIKAFSITTETAGCKTEIETILDITRIEDLFNERYNLLKQFGVLIAERTVLYDKIYTIVHNGMDEQGQLNETDLQALELLKSDTLSSMETSAGIQSRLALIEEMGKNRSRGSFINASKVFPGVVIKVGKEERVITAEEQNFQVMSSII